MLKLLVVFVLITKECANVLIFVESWYVLCAAAAKIFTFTKVH